MKIIVAQQDKKLEIIFNDSRNWAYVDKFVIDKADEFLVCVDKLTKKHHTAKISWKDVKLEFRSTGLLTERIIRAIVLGLSFSQN